MQPPCVSHPLVARVSACLHLPLHSENIVVPLPSNTSQEMESNVQRIMQWLAAYKSQHGL